MGIDVKNIIQVCACRILKFLMNTCYKCVQKHPLVSGILLLFFLLYNLYPYVILFLINTAPVIVCTLVLLRILVTSKSSKPQKVEKDEKRNHGMSSKNSGSVEDDLIIDRNDSSSLQTQMGRQKNVKGKNKEFDDLIGPTELTEETHKEIQKREANSCLDCIGSSYHHDSNTGKVQTLDERCDSEAPRADFDEGCDKFNGQGGELDGESPEEAEDDDEEEAHDKAVEWTEDDQKNLMDLGTSEIERNKRLESLIFKRRARKLYRNQVDKNLIDMDDDPQSHSVAPILVGRSNLLGVPGINSEGTDYLLMPGSAPSVLLPTRNPFDLPYDPLEEKPNLMGDSFQQEFMAVHQKDMFFCRHESFSLGHSFLEPRQDRHNINFNPFFVAEWKASEGPDYPRFKTNPNERGNEKLTKQALFKEAKPIFHTPSDLDLIERGGQHPLQVLNLEEIELEDYRETDNSMIQVKGEEEKENAYDNSDSSSSSSSSSSEESEENFNISNKEASENVKPIVGNFPPVCRNSAQKPPSYVFPKNTGIEVENNGKTNEAYYESIPSASPKARMEEHLFQARKRENHTRTCSISSDLQVEISEVGSPPLTVDGTISPGDGESLTYDGDLEREIPSGSEEIWGESSHLCGVEENESRSREVHAITAKDIIDVGFSGVNQNSEDPITSPVLPELVVKEFFINTSSVSSPRTELAEEGQAHSMDFNRNTHDETEQVVKEEIKETMSPGSSDSLPRENLAVAKKAQDLRGEMEAYPFGGGDSEKPEEPSNLPEKSTREVSIIYNVSDQMVQASEDTESLQVIEDQYGEAKQLIKKEADKDLSKVADETTSRSIENTEHNFEEPEEHQTILEPYKQVKENENSESNKEFEGEFGKQIEHEGITEEPNPNEDKDNLNSTEDNEGEQSTVQFGYSVVNQNSDDPIVSAEQPEVVVEQVPIESSSSLSPKSVLPESVPTDQAPSLNFHQVMHVDAQQSDVEDNSLHEMPLENLSPATPQNVQHLIEDSMALPSNYYRNPKKLQEPSNPPGKSMEEANINFNANESVASEKEDNVNLRSVEDSEGESQLSQEAVEEQSKPAEETSSRSMEDVEGKSEKLIEDEAVVGPSKSREENVNSSTIKDVEELKESIEHEDITHQSKPAEAKHDLRASEDAEGESKNLTGYEAMVDPLKPEEEKDSSNISVTVVEGKESSNPSPVDSTEESNIPHNANESIVVMQPLEATESSTVKSTEDIESKSIELTEDKVITGPSNPVDKTDNPKTVKAIEGSALLTDHEDATDPPEPGKARDSLKEAIEDVKEAT